jgi:hypothetical protein
VSWSVVDLNPDPEGPRGGVSGARIRDCLEETLPTIADPGKIFMHDNSRTFTAHAVQRWLRYWAGSHHIRLLNWHPYPPDLNPIENLWFILKDKIIEAYTKLADMPKNDETKQRLCEASVAIWEEIGDNVLENLLHSMQERMQVVIDAKGCPHDIDIYY